MSFWENVCIELEYQNITRKELSAKINVPVQTINRAIERNSKVYAEDALKIANALNVTVDFLLDLNPSKSNISDSSKTDDANYIRLYKKYASLINFMENCSEEQKSTIKHFSEQFSKS